jgi:hypothetical protein
MNEADRIAAERAAVARRGNENAVASARRDKLARIAQLADEASRLIPAALDAKARNNYEGIEQVSVYPPPSLAGRLFSSGRARKMGAYLIWEGERREGSMGWRRLQVHLASDRHLIVGTGAQTVNGFADSVKNHERVGDQKGNYSNPLSEVYSIAAFEAIVDALRQIAGLSQSA